MRVFNAVSGAVMLATAVVCYGVVLTTPGVVGYVALVLSLVNAMSAGVALHDAAVGDETERFRARRLAAIRRLRKSPGGFRGDGKRAIGTALFDGYGRRKRARRVG